MRHCILLLASVIGLISLHAQGSSQLDPTFGQSGRVRLAYPTFSATALTTLAIQPDGKLLLILKDLNPSPPYPEELHRLLSNGQYDPGFGNNGVYLLPGFVEAKAAIVNAAGQIILAGLDAQENLGWLTRLQPDGQIDTTFGDSGTVHLKVGTATASLSSLAIAPNGDILAAGKLRGSAAFEGGIFRLSADGNLDPSFGSSGVLVVGAGNFWDKWRLTVLSGGRITIGYSRRDTVNIYDAVLKRFLPDGTPDGSFGQNGTLLIVDTTTTIVSDFGIQADGKVIIAGQLGEVEPVFPWLRRFSANAGPDFGYGDQGTALLSPCLPSTSPNEFIEEIEVLPNGHAYSIGDFGCEAPGQQILKSVVSLTPDGEVDTTFGQQGLVHLALPDSGFQQGFYGTYLNQMALAPDGKIYVAASIRRGDSGEVYLFRLLPSALVAGVEPQPASASAWRLYPNPLDEALWLEGSFGPHQTILLQGYTANGQLMLQRHWQPTQIGHQHKKWSLASLNLASGLYVFRVTAGNTQRTFRMIKR